MVDVSSGAVAIPVADLTYPPTRHTEFNGNDFSQSTFPSDRFVPSSFVPNQDFVPDTFVRDGASQSYFEPSPVVFPPVQDIPAIVQAESPVTAPAEVVQIAPSPKIDPPLVGGTKYLTSRAYENLGTTTCQPLENGRVMLFEIERFPVSDAGACELAIVVQDHLRSLHLTAPVPVVVHIRSVSHDYIDKYSGRQLPEHETYPCQLLDQALPMGMRFKVVSGDADFITGLRNKYYDSFIAETVDQALLTEKRAWREANTHGEEFQRLPTYRDMLEDRLHALESRRAEALKAARRFVAPVVTEVQQHSNAFATDAGPVVAAL